MARIFQIKRGAKANLPTLAQGEFAMTTDSGAEELWLGTGSKNKKIPLDPTAADVGAFARNGNIGMNNADPIVYPTTASGATRLRVYSGKNASYNGGAGLVLTNKDAPANAGSFELTAHNGTSSAILTGKPDGLLAWKGNPIYHAGNKPTAADVGALALDGSNRLNGEYTGNGSSASRTFEVGTSSEVMVIFSAIGMVWVGITGAICIDNRSGEVFGLEGVFFDHGMFGIATDSEFVNGARTDYWYQVL